MTDDEWAWFLFVAELAGLAAMSQLVGRRRLWFGWLVVAACVSVPWIAFSLLAQPIRFGFLALSLLWLSTYATNAARWRKGKETQ
jgi:hypothetical protein